MSFKFNESAFKDNSFNEKIRDKLSNALNEAFNKNRRDETIVDDEDGISSKGRKQSTSTNILKSGIKVNKVNFPDIPQVDILDLNISMQPRSLVKGICKLSVKNAMIQIQAIIESNLLLLNVEDSPKFVTPTLIENNSFAIPITMTFKEIQLEAITNIFMRNHGVSISFNDVDLDFEFECSIKILQTTIERRLKDSLQSLFKDVLPSIIFNMSQSWFSHNGKSGKRLLEQDNTLNAQHKITLDESDLQELSTTNMLRLSTMVSSRHTLSLHGTNELSKVATIPGCLEKQNMYRFISKMPSLTNYYLPYGDKESKPDEERKIKPTQSNVLPTRVLREHKFDINTIIEIQNKLYERSITDEEELAPRRRIIKFGGKKKSKKIETPLTPKTRSPTPIVIPSLQPVTVNPIPLKEATPGRPIDQGQPIAHNSQSNHVNINEPPSPHNIVTRRISNPHLTKRPISFVGINHHGWKWGNEDHSTSIPPPPYTEKTKN